MSTPSITEFNDLKKQLERSKCENRALNDQLSACTHKIKDLSHEASTKVKDIESLTMSTQRYCSLYTSSLVSRKCSINAEHNLLHLLNEYHVKNAQLIKDKCLGEIRSRNMSYKIDEMTNTILYLKMIIINSNIDA